VSLIKDYRIKLTVRNERLLSAMEEKGFPSVRKFCEINSLAYMTIVNVVSGKIKPLNNKGEVVPCVKKLLEILDLPIDEAFTPRQLKGFKKNTFNFSVKEKELTSLMNPVQNTELKLIESDVNTALHNSLQSLSKNEQLVIKHRFGINTETKTLEETSKLLGGITRERVRQIEKTALKRLQHPSRICKILEAGVKDVYTSIDIDDKDVRRADLWLQTKEQKIN